jgi:hypothetical protein
MEIGEEINPRKPEEAIAHIKRDAERRIAGGKPRGRGGGHSITRRADAGLAVWTLKQRPG